MRLVLDKSGEIIMTDEFYFHLISTPLKPSLEIAFSEHKEDTHYRIEPKRLTFAWHENAGEDFMRLIVPMDAETAEPVIRKWLKEQAEWGPSDEDEVRSWLISNKGLSRWSGPEFYQFVYIEPYWATLSK